TAARPSGERSPAISTPPRRAPAERNLTTTAAPRTSGERSPAISTPPRRAPAEHSPTTTVAHNPRSTARRPRPVTTVARRAHPLPTTAHLLAEEAAASTAADAGNLYPSRAGITPSPSSFHRLIRS